MLHILIKMTKNQYSLNSFVNIKAQKGRHIWKGYEYLCQYGLLLKKRKKKNLFICLAVACGVFIVSCEIFHCNVWTLAAAHWPSCFREYGILVPNPGIKSMPSTLQDEFSITRTPGKYLWLSAFAGDKTETERDLTLIKCSFNLIFK